VLSASLDRGIWPMPRKLLDPRPVLKERREAEKRQNVLGESYASPTPVLRESYAFPGLR